MTLISYDIKQGTSEWFGALPSSLVTKRQAKHLRLTCLSDQPPVHTTWALFGRAPKGAPAPAPRGALPNRVRQRGSDHGAGGEAATGFHWGGGATKTWLHPAPPPSLPLCPQCRGRPERHGPGGGAGWARRRRRRGATRRGGGVAAGRRRRRAEA
jgi:hypothetical protein